MNAVMHIVLHLTLCTATVHGSAAVHAVHVELDTRIGTSVVDKVFPVSGDNPYDTEVDLDAPRGVFLLQANQLHSACGATQYVDLLPDADRSIAMKMTPNGMNERPRVPNIFDGASPEGFDYTDPTIVLLDGSVNCDQPVGDPLTTDSIVENDSSSYYVSFFGYTAKDPALPKIALRLTDTQGDYRYVRMNLPVSWQQARWPSTARFDVSSDLVGEVLEKPTDVLLCLKLLRTSSG